ncbi:hypothetical protein [Pseudanabaena sp. Chao 1811]|uniref:hypothetical protein n=1 Tax=Pseudanabaena sp. Chao 1811 TaxID=2963092 RepID=UPI0022F38D33|nr:hypothetical protein [Pseudanabaena sp. Chao 1811]
MSEIYRGTFQELKPKLLDSFSDELHEDDRYDALTLIRSELDVTEPIQEEAEYRSINRDLLSSDYYAIHNDDLKFLKECSVVAAAIYAGMPNPVGIAGGLTAFLFRYRKKRVKLTMQEGVVLKTLAKAPSIGWTIDELIENKPLLRLVPMPDVAAILENLKSVTKGDNTTTALVAQNGNRWRAIDV